MLRGAAGAASLKIHINYMASPATRERKQRFKVKHQSFSVHIIKNALKVALGQREAGYEGARFIRRHFQPKTERNEVGASCPWDISRPIAQWYHGSD